MRFITNLYTNGLQINVSMLGSFLYVMGCQIKYLRSMKGLMSLTRTRKHIKLKVLLLKFGVLHRLKWILSGTLLSGFHFFLVLYFNLTFFFISCILVRNLKWSLFCFCFPVPFLLVCAPHCYMQIVLENILYSYVPNTNEETYFHPITC